MTNRLVGRQIGGRIDRLIGVDWGTSSLRLFLMHEGRVVDKITTPQGIMRMKRAAYGALFSQLVTPWREQYGDVPAVACGMVGSAQGWQEVKYCVCPATANALSRGMAAVGEHDFYIIPGVECGKPHPNVMRGEETEIVGVIAQDQALFERALLVMPGTHSKWVPVQEGAIQPFQTFMTGELYALLSQHSILGRPYQENSQSCRDEEKQAAFEQGVKAALQEKYGVAAHLFSTRVLVLRHGLHPAASLDYLSGLLIGEELRCGLGLGAPSAIIAEAALARKYQHALQLAGFDGVKIIGDAAAAGLWHIAQALL